MSQDLPCVRRRAGRSLACIFIIYALLVGTHLGEFWPFSIYPMFSTAGQPWTRVLVHALPPELDESVMWRSGEPAELPGEVFPLGKHGIYQNDLSNYIGQTRTWTPERIEGVESMFRGRVEDDEQVMIYRVRGVLENDRVRVSATPLMLVAPPDVHLAEDSSSGTGHE